MSESPVPDSPSNPRLLHRRRRHRALLACVLLVGGVAWAGAAPAHGKARGRAAGTLSIQVIRDRLTLAVTRVPQVYLYGELDAGAPQRFAALVAAGRIPAGSDVYLNSPHGDLAAGIALGRQFRRGAMATHLGTPRRPGHASQASKTAVCVGACAYAYFGGLYRWAPTGSDRIGLDVAGAAASPAGQPAAAAGDAAAYLASMGIELGRAVPAPSAAPGTVSWLSADRMLAAGLANNGRLPLTVSYQLAAPEPELTLNQVDRRGEHRLVVQCRPGQVTLSAYDLVGSKRAREIVARGTHSYFAIDRQERLTQPRGGAQAINDAVLISRPYPPGQLGQLLASHSIGAWVGGSNNAFRDGFSFQLDAVQRPLHQYYLACWRAAPWPVKPAP